MFAINDVPVSCINQAAIEYHVPASVIISVIKTENGKVGEANLNKDGSYDYGPMQINSRWIFQLRHAGYTSNDLQFDACKNVTAGTWVLAQAIADGKTFWSGIADYHSHTPYYNIQYQNKVKIVYGKINEIINS